VTKPAPGKWRYKKPEKTPGRVCIDCRSQGVTTVRPAPHGGPRTPRCSTHWNEEKRRKRVARSVKHVESTYELTDEEYQALYQFQGGRCYICQRANGTSKRLAVDHNHRLPCSTVHGQTKGCRACVRGLVCSVDNDILAHLRDDPTAALRIHEYLVDPPWLRLQRNV
jgi:hypothetical protein